mgnify:CR=1 FL=1
MNDKITITKDGVDTIYVREDKIMQNTGVGLYRDFKFCGLDWQVIDEDAETTTLLAKFCLNKEIIKEVFASDEYDSDYDVKFSDNSSEWRWKNSIIRKRLNDKFLKMLNKEQLVPMTTTIWLNGESSTTKDYVRLLTLDEIQRLPKSVKESKAQYYFWSLSPYNFYGGFANVFRVYTTGNLNITLVDFGGAVAPVIKLKRSSLKEC